MKFEILLATYSIINFSYMYIVPNPAGERCMQQHLMARVGCKISCWSKLNESCNLQLSIALLLKFYFMGFCSDNFRIYFGVRHHTASFALIRFLHALFSMAIINNIGWFVFRNSYYLLPGLVCFLFHILIVMLSIGL